MGIWSDVLVNTFYENLIWVIAGKLFVSRTELIIIIIIKELLVWMNKNIWRSLIKGNFFSIWLHLRRSSTYGRKQSKTWILHAILQHLLFFFNIIITNNLW